MSLIAAFYLVPNEKRSSLLQAARAQASALKKKRWGILPPKLPLNYDPFWEFVQNELEELEHFEYSGNGIVDLELLAEGLLDTTDTLGKELYEIQQSSFISFSPEDASKVRQKLEALTLDSETLASFLSKAGRDDELPDIAEPLESARSILIRWVSCVSQGQTGLLNVG